jgi:hypothetical protein
MSIGPELYGYDPTQDELTPDQLPAPPASTSDLNSALATVQGPELLPLPSQYVEQQFQPTGFGRALEGLNQSYGGRPHIQPRGFGQGFAAALLGSLSGQGARVAEARSKFQSAEDARRRLIDEERKAATAENNRRTGQFGQAKTNAVITNAVNTETFNRNAPVREAAAKAQAQRDRLAQENADRQQRNLDRQTDLLTANTTDTLSQHFNADPDIVGYRTQSNNVNLAKTAANQRNGVGDNAIIRLYVRSTDDPRIASVVRESEAAGVQASVGLLAKAKVLPATWVHGDLLTDEGRNAILKAMRETASTLKPQYDKAYDQYRQRALQVGKASGIKIDPSVLLREYTTPYDFTKTAASNADFQSANK